MARARSSASSGQLRLEGMAYVLVEIFAKGTDELHDAAGVDVDGVGLEVQVAGNLGGGMILEDALHEAGPDPGGDARPDDLQRSA